MSFTENSTLNENLNFTVEFWQPFINYALLDKSVLICGPFLGLAIEISRSLKKKSVFKKF